MKKSELNHLQSEHLNFFNLILEYHNWEDTNGIEKALDGGESVNPEGVRNYSNEKVQLEAQFHAPIQMLSLRVSDHQQKQNVHIFFYYGNSPVHILEWLGSICNDLDLEKLPSLLHVYRNRFAEIDETILISVTPSKVYELTPVKNG